MYDFIFSKIYRTIVLACSIIIVNTASIPAADVTQKIMELEQKTKLVDEFLRSNDERKLENNIFIIDKIIIKGNKYISTDIILNSLPYKRGMIFDACKSADALKNLYALGHFLHIRLLGEAVDDKSMNLYVIIEEKKLLQGFEFEGNKNLKTAQIKEKLGLDKLITIDEETLFHIGEGIKKLYREENRHFVEIKTSLIPNEQNSDKVIAHLAIHEGPTSTVTRVHFKGNTKIPDRILAKSIFTRENWLLSFVDSAGTYHEDAIESDKHQIERAYRDKGYLMAKVTNVDVQHSKSKKSTAVTFTVNEGEEFTIRSITAPGDEIFTEDELLPLISLKEGSPYSQTEMLNSMNRMRNLWGEKGYIYADVYPQIKPDETTNEVDITFHSERGNKLYVNRINITGNRTTRDKIIRRQFDDIIGENDLITTKKLQQSKNAVEYLSFFERDGVNWHIHRLSDALADLEMNVKETKTGHAYFQVSYGSDRYSPRPSLRGTLNVEKSNLFGLGVDVGGLIQASRHRIQRLEAHIADPYLFDSDVAGALFVYKRWEEYEQWRSVNTTPVQTFTGGDVRFTFRLPQLDKKLQLMLDLGVEDIRNKNMIFANGSDSDLFSPVVRRSFKTGTLTWIGADLIRDTRNHQVYPNHGHRVSLSVKLAPPATNHQFSFIKTEIQASLYNALIGTDTLVLANRFRTSIVRKLSDNKPIPYKELFHMGGQTTVRGFIWGSIGPAWRASNDPLGAQNALLFNTELIFPLIEDYSMKGHFFYDAGAGWDTPKDDISNLDLIKRDKLTLRHSVGFGLNLSKPFPAKIDWGFKLDRRKQDGESAHEFHLTMNYAW